VRREGKIQLLCKGADSLIFERMHPKCADLKELTVHHLNVSKSWSVIKIVIF